MSDGKHCDNCGSWEKRAGIYSWFHIERPSHGRWLERDFCSLECIQEWAHKEAAERESRRMSIEREVPAHIREGK